MSPSETAGWLLLDKEAGPSSAQALARVKQAYSVKRAGHTGTLDPLASGLLVIALGSTTRWCGYLLDADKSYQFTLHLGVSTDTQDEEGLERAAPAKSVPTLGPSDIEQLLAQFTGTISQIPPMHSAVQVEGQRLYRLARQGKSVEREAREVTVKRLVLLAQHETRWELEVDCGKGLYVRTLGHDIGQALGCGAYISDLRRTQVGPFHVAQAARLEQLSCEEEGLGESWIRPDEEGLPDWPHYHCSAKEERTLRSGGRIEQEDLEGRLKLFDASGHFFGLGEIHADGLIRSHRLLPSPMDFAPGSNGGSCIIDEP